MSSPPLLSRFVEEELARATPLIDEVVQSVLSGRGQMATQAGRSPQERQLEHELMQTLARYRPTVAQRFVEELRDKAHAEMEKSPAGKGSSRAPPAKLTLSLLDEVEVTADVELSRVIESINSVAEYELRELRAFTAAMVGDESVSRETNPLHAETYAHALLAAGRALPLSRGHQLLFMRLASAPLAQGIRVACASACTRLEAQGIEPSVYKTIVQPKSAPRRSGPMSSVSPSDQYIDFDPPPAMPQIRVPDLSPPRTPAASSPPPLPPLRMNINLNELRDSMPVPLDPPRTQSPPLDQVLLLDEEKLRLLPSGAGGSGGGDGRSNSPSQLIGSQRRQMLRTTSSRVDQQLIELLARLFDAILADRRVSAPFQVLLSRLHASALRVALREPDMLDAYSHPVWMFMDRLAFQGVIHSTDSGDPELAAVLRQGQTLIDHIAREPQQDGALYRWAFDRLASYERHRFDERRQALAGQIEELRRLSTEEAAASAGQAMLDVQTMDTVPADLLHTAPADLDDASRWLTGRQSGQWLKAFLQGRWRVVQLIWRGESVWLLAEGVSHPHTWAVRLPALELLHAEQLLESLEPVSLIQSAAERVLEEMAAADPDMPPLIQDTQI